MKFKRGLKNILFGVTGQLIILALEIVIPRMVIMSYGSAVNGMFGSINNIFKYVALLEAGIGAATIQALYQPISADDRDSISSVLSATKIYYRRVSLYYLICVVALAFIYPALVNTEGISSGFLGMTSPIAIKISVGAVTLMAGLAGVINFYFQATLKQLMAAEGRNYVDSNISLIVNILLSSTKILLIQLGADIVIIQSSYLVIRLLQMIIYMTYFRKHYSWVDFNAKPNFESIKQKSAFLMHQITGLIFSSTDTIILTFSSRRGLHSASIYSTYNLVITALHTLCNTVNNSLQFMLGLTYHENKERYLKLHDAYNTYYITFIFSMISVCYLMFRPFILMYTKGADINYDLPYLPLLFCLIQLLSATRSVSNNLIAISGHMRATVWRSMVEAGINVAVSLGLVVLFRFKGIESIYAVLIGTVVALLYRTNDIIIYTDVKILNRNPLHTYKPVFVNFALFGFIVFLSSILNIRLNSWLQFIGYGVLFGVTVIPAYFIINSLFAVKDFSFVYGILKDKLSKSKIIKGSN